MLLFPILQKALSRPLSLFVSSTRRSATMSASKKPCTVKSIGTHDGVFHCDEALACYMLRKLPEYSDAKLVRSRDDTVLKSCDIVVDVGGVYDPSIHRYDHHQRSFSGSMNSLTEGKKKWVTKLSSAGLVYLHFGHRILASITEGISTESPAMEDLYDYVYSEFMEEIDAKDNGISDRDGEPRYSINSTIGMRVRRLNPEWNEPTPSSEDTMKRFEQAMELVGGELLETVKYFQKSWLPAKEIVQKAIQSRHEIHESGEVIKLEPFCPWKNHLFSLEQSLSVPTSIKYTLYTDKSTKWRVQAVPINPNTFENRLSLPEAWRGLRGAELDTVAGIQGCVFVHSNGFIGGHETFEGALKMAVTSLKLQLP